ncbi:hypothetical protein SNEBB_004321 [Seison nebaliae]|nr:hypothetical protein SNEBB_004321 [Seison nebaliae]
MLIECAICTNKEFVTEGKTDLCVCPCGHVFHSYCFDSWIGTKRFVACPLCRYKCQNTMIIRSLILSVPVDESSKSVEGLNLELNQLRKKNKEKEEKMRNIEECNKLLEDKCNELRKETENISTKLTLQKEKTFKYEVGYKLYNHTKQLNENIMKRNEELEEEIKMMKDVNELKETGTSSITYHQYENMENKVLIKYLKARNEIIDKMRTKREEDRLKYCTMEKKFNIMKYSLFKLAHQKETGESFKITIKPSTDSVERILSVRLENEEEKDIEKIQFIFTDNSIRHGFEYKFRTKQLEMEKEKTTTLTTTRKPLTQQQALFASPVQCSSNSSPYHRKRRQSKHFARPNLILLKYRKAH